MNDGDPVDWSQFYQDMASVRRDPPRQSSTMDLTMPIAIDVAAAASSASRGKSTARKRSRASRRAPTTLLNTDTSNFRAMVQQFTGVPAAPHATSYTPAGAPTTTLNFGIRFNNPAIHSNQYQYQQQQQQQQALAAETIRYVNIPDQHRQYRQPQQQQEMIGFGIGENIEDGMPEEFFLDGMGGQPAENNRGHGYFL